MIFGGHYIGAFRTLVSERGSSEPANGQWVFFNDRGYDSRLMEPTLIMAWTKTYEQTKHIVGYLHLRPELIEEWDSLDFPILETCSIDRLVERDPTFQGIYLKSDGQDSACGPAKAPLSVERIRNLRRENVTVLDY